MVIYCVFTWQVREYAGVFWERFEELAEFEKYMKNIERGEQKIQRFNDIMHALAAKIEYYKNPWKDLKVCTTRLADFVAGRSNTLFRKWKEILGNGRKV